MEFVLKLLASAKRLAKSNMQFIKSLNWATEILRLIDFLNVFFDCFNGTNGTYERNHESGIEANYDMEDGQVNNQKKVVEKA